VGLAGLVVAFTGPVVDGFGQFRPQQGADDVGLLVVGAALEEVGLTGLVVAFAELVVEDFGQFGPQQGALDVGLALEGAALDEVGFTGLVVAFVEGDGFCQSCQPAEEVVGLAELDVGLTGAVVGFS
jgi:hypothetical protein